MKTGDPGKTRTCGIEFRRLAFCSTELRGRKWQGIGESNSGLRIENPASWPLDEYSMETGEVDESRTRISGLRTRSPGRWKTTSNWNARIGADWWAATVTIRVLPVKSRVLHR